MARKNGGKGGIHVDLDPKQWPGFTAKEVQDLLCKHMRAKKSKKSKGKNPKAHIYVGFGKNPMTFSITICPQYPCSA